MSDSLPESLIPKEVADQVDRGQRKVENGTDLLRFALANWPEGLSLRATAA